MSARTLLTQATILGIIISSVIPSATSIAPQSLAFLVPYVSLVVIYAIIARKIHKRIAWKTACVAVLPFFLIPLFWILGSALPPVVFIFFASLLLSLVVTLSFIISLNDSRQH